MTDFDNGGKDPIKMWSITNITLIILSILAFYNIGFIAGLITGILDLILIYPVKIFFNKNNIRARYEPTESAGKHILFIGSYTLILGITIEKIINNTPEINIALLIAIIVVACCMHILVRLFVNSEIMHVKYDYKGYYMKHIKDKDTPIKYIFDQYDGCGPIYAVILEKYNIEICGNYKYKNKIYEIDTVFNYAKKYNKSIEELNSYDYNIIENIYIYKDEVYDLKDSMRYMKEKNEKYISNLRDNDFKLIQKV